MKRNAVNMIKHVRHFNLALLDKANNFLEISVIYFLGAETFSLSYLPDDVGREKAKILRQRFQFRFEMLYLAKR